MLCPECLRNKHSDIVLEKSTVNPDKLRCPSCCGYFDKRDEEFVRKTYDDTNEVLWRGDEVACAKDRPLAKFYEKLNLADRCIFAGAHISLCGDFRQLRMPPAEHADAPEQVSPYDFPPFTPLPED